MAGEHGYAPLSLAFGAEYLRGHWSAVSVGAEAAGKSTDRDGWGIVWDVFVAESDDEAVSLCLESGVGDYLREFWLPLMADVGLIAMYKRNPEMADSEVTPEYFLRNAAIVGSVDTVRREDRSRAGRHRWLRHPDPGWPGLCRQSGADGGLDGAARQRGPAAGQRGAGLMEGATKLREAAGNLATKPVTRELREASDETIEDSIQAADPMVLRGLLYQLTGDETLAATCPTRSRSSGAR